MHRFHYTLVVFLFTSVTCGQDNTRVSGVISPLDDSSFYVLDKTGQKVVTWNQQTKVAIQIGFTNFKPRNHQIEYTIHSSTQKHRIELPRKPAYAVIDRRRFDPKERGNDYLVPRGLKVFFSPTPDHFPTLQENYYAGKFDLHKRVLEIKESDYEIKMPSGKTDIHVYDVLTPEDCRPFVNKANVVGMEKDGKILAKEIHLVPLGDQTVNDDPQLPRYLFIGDSISGNYDRGLRGSLQGKFNLHHPPTNCGPASKGEKEIRDWLGDYRVKGRQWDVISFNFGHWDVGKSKMEYQTSLEAVIRELKKTKAMLIWVTTCPVPDGFEKTDGLDSLGKAPGRKAGVMRQYINPWAMEVISKHPEITVCDQWQFVEDGRGDAFKEWWQGQNVHFHHQHEGKLLGEFLGKHIWQTWNMAQ